MLPKTVYWAKFEGKLLSDAKCPGPLLQRSSLNRLSLHKRHVMEVLLCMVAPKEIGRPCVIKFFCGTFPDYNIFALEFSKLFMLNISKTQIGSRFPLFFLHYCFLKELIIVGRCCNFVAFPHNSWNLLLNSCLGIDHRKVQICWTIALFLSVSILYN